MILYKTKIHEKLKSYGRVKFLDAETYRPKPSLEEEKAKYYMIKRKNLKVKIKVQRRNKHLPVQSSINSRRRKACMQQIDEI